LQKYSAPPITDLPWPDSAKLRQQFDSDLASIQSKLAIHTRPLDKYVLDAMQDDSRSDESTLSAIEGVSDLIEHIKQISHYIHDLRVQNLERAHGLQLLTRKSNAKTPAVDSQSLLEKKKLLLSIKRNLYSNSTGRGSNRNRHDRNNNFPRNSAQSSYSNQGQSNQSQSQPDSNNNISGGNRHFYNARGNSNRGRERGRGRGHQQTTDHQ
ncbi:hypothetical protein BX616_009131, partial [Lobosporangium transversale]